MNKYGTIVVGSGISGLSVSLLLALNGVKVLLVEKAPRIGGSLPRFYRRKVPFNVGFNFTGGMQPGGTIRMMLEVLGLMDLLEPYRFLGKYSMRFRFDAEGRSFDLPHGVPEVIEALAGYFPREAERVAGYFATLQRIVARTSCMAPDDIALEPVNLPEDRMTLDQALKDLTGDRLLRGVLAGPATCYGVRPSEVSFANHARMCLNFYEGLGFVRDGGDAIVAAFRKRMAEAGVETACNESIAALEDVEDKRVRRFVLASGREVSADNCVFTIHPHEILKILPVRHFRKGFVERVRSFEGTIGFFSAYGAMASREGDSEIEETIISMFPHAGIDELLDPANRRGPLPLAFKVAEETGSESGPVRPVEFLEVAFREDTAEWEDSRTGERPAAYYRYKEDKVRRILERTYAAFPGYRDRIEVFDSGSMLTYRDYLNSPDGSAYGIKQKIGQFNVLGQLSLRNLYAAGQSSLMPGVMGAMISSFMIGSAVLGKDRYDDFIRRCGIRAHA